MVPALSSRRWEHLDHLASSSKKLMLEHFGPPHIFFPAVTHLVLLDALESIAIDLAALPGLTHLCVSPGRGNALLLPGIVAKCAQLRVLVSMDFESESDGKPRAAAFLPDVYDDPRLVLMTMSTLEYVVDWNIGVSGGPDFWTRAEIFIAKRRRGEIKPGATIHIIRLLSLIIEFTK